MVLRAPFLMLALSLGLLVGGPAAAAEVVNAEGESLRIARNQGVLVRMDSAVDSVFVADAAIADVQVKSPRLVYVFGNEVGETTLFAVNANDEVVVSRRLAVHHDLAGLRRALAELEPTQSISARAVQGAVVLTGRVSSSAVAEDARRVAALYAEEEKVINRLRITQPTQVNLRVRVAEVDRTLSKDLGVRWNNLRLGTDDAISFSGGALTDAAGSFLTRLTGSTGDLSADVLIDALAEENLVTVLAEPNLTAVSGETANFLAGGEFPIPVSGDEDSIEIEFKEFGVRLEFTPTILDERRISLKVAPEVSELDFASAVDIFADSNVRVPAIATRRAKTTVELASGQSFAIAGLLQNTSTQTISNLPGLGDLPVLGALFRSNSFQRGETELAIIVTPYIVQPSSDDRMALPTDGLTPPNDIERILFGRMYGERAAERRAAEAKLSSQELAGPVGFMLE